jgi:hypothetical protein
MVKVSFVIVNYNTRELLKDCIENLLLVKGKIGELEIIAVDNGSTDGSAEMVESNFGQSVKLIRTENNGLSAGHNLGYKSSRGEYIVYLGTDAYPTARAMEMIIEYMDRHEKAGICTPKLVLRDGSLDMDAHRGHSTPWTSLSHWLFLDKIFPKSKFFNGYFMGYKDFSKPHEIDVCISHFMFVRREAHEKVGLFDESFFLYGEDLDFCYRMQQAGYKVMYLSNIEVLHFKGATVGRKATADLDNAARRDKKHLSRLRLETTKAMKKFYKKHLEKKYPAPLNWLVYLGIFLLEKLRVVLFALRRSQSLFS